MKSHKVELVGFRVKDKNNKWIWWSWDSDVSQSEDPQLFYPNNKYTYYSRTPFEIFSDPEFKKNRMQWWPDHYKWETAELFQCIQTTTYKQKL